MLTGLDWLVPLDFVTVFACASLVVRASSAASATAVAAFATTAKRVSNTSNTAPINEWVKRLTGPADRPPERSVAATTWIFSMVVCG